MFYTVTDIVDMSGGFPDIGPKVNKTNLHSSIWSLILLYSEETENDEYRETFKLALSKIDNVSPEDLYNLLLESLPDYGTSEYAVFSYAEKIVYFNKEELYAR